MTHKKPSSWMDVIRRNRDLRIKYEDQFLDTFGVQLSNYMEGIFGFDIVRFDKEVIKPPDWTSTKDHIFNEYGEDALNMVIALINADSSDLDPDPSEIADALVESNRQ